MIQINLLREATGQRRVWVPRKSRAELWMGLVVAVAVVGVLGWHWHLSSVREAAVVRRAELQEESARLAAVRAELQRYERQRALLEERARVIENLRATQKGPVQMMNAVIAAMPSEPRLWLTSLSQQERTVSIEGHAFDVPAIADFIANLGKYPPFQTVELAFWEDRQDSVAFGLNCRLSH